MSVWRRPMIATAILLLAWGAAIGPEPANAQQAPTQPVSTQPTKFSSAELEQMVAPIALYPDNVLAQVLMASTYPLEVVEAARWSKENPQVAGVALETAMQQQNWDPSVKALTAVPQALHMMNDKLQWTQSLGDAFLAQEGDVMSAVQRLRARADAAGNLNTGPQQKVTRVTQPPAAAPRTSGSPLPPAAAQPVYTIEPVTAGEYYLPIYDPNLAFGAWPYPDYAPLYWYPPGYAAVGAFSFAAGVLTGAAIWGRADWWRGNVNVNVNRFNQFNRTNITNNTWRHNAAHRGGVPYRDRAVAQRFGGDNRAAQRDAIRNRQGGAGNAANRAGNLGKQGNIGQKGKAAARSGGAKQAAAGNRSRQNAAGNRAKQNAGNRQGARSNQAARSKQGARQAGARANTRQAGRPGNVGRRGGAPNMARAGGRSMGSRGASMRAGGGGFRGGGGRGGRRSDIALKHDISLLGHLDNGLGFYRFRYHDDATAYVGVMAQDVQGVAPAAVSRASDGTLRVNYDLIGVRFQTYRQWIRSGGRVPVGTH